MDESTVLYDSFVKEPESLTFDELRQRLKSVATLCIGLSIDLNNEIQLREDITAENTRLKSELEYAKHKYDNLRGRYSGTLSYYHKKYGYHVRRARSGDNDNDNTE